MPARRPPRATTVGVTVLGPLAATLLVATGATPDAAAANGSVPRLAQVTARQLITSVTAEGTLTRTSQRSLFLGDTAPAPEAGPSDRAGGGSAPVGEVPTATVGTPSAYADDDAGADSAPLRTDQSSTGAAVRVRRASYEQPAPTSPEATEGPTASPSPSQEPTPAPSTAPAPLTQQTPAPQPHGPSSQPVPGPVSAGTDQAPTRPPGPPTGSTMSGARGALPPSAPAWQAAAPSGTAATARTLTALAATGTAVVDGTVLYAVDGEPVMAVVGSFAPWRALSRGVDDGQDVRDLEEALVAAGHGADLAVDEQFTATTAARVEDWERALGRSDPDGRVEVGDLVAVPADHTVLEHDAVAGAGVVPGSRLLRLGGSAQSVALEVGADRAAAWPQGATVTLRWSDGTTSAATVSGRGRDVVDDAVEVTVEVGVSGRDTGAPVTAVLAVDGAPTVLSVPVAAVVATLSGAPAVQLEDGELVVVELGTVAGGWVEVRGVDASTVVRLPS